MAVSGDLSWDDVPIDALEEINEHGVKGETWSRTFVPYVCMECKHFEDGETGDYGTVYSYPGCMLGMMLPTRKGTCKRRTPTAE